jgi:hypothetical protein
VLHCTTAYTEGQSAFTQSRPVRPSPSLRQSPNHANNVRLWDLTSNANRGPRRAPRPTRAAPLRTPDHAVQLGFAWGFGARAMSL